MKLINKIILQELKPHRGRLFFAFLLILLGVFFEALTPWPFKILIDNVLGDKLLDLGNRFAYALSFITSKEALGFFAIFIYCISSISTETIEYFRTIFIKKIGRDMVNDFAQNAFENMEQLAVGYYKKQEIGDYIYRLSYDVSAIGDFLESGIIPLVTNSFFFATTLCVLFLIHKTLTLLAVAIIPILIIALKIFNNKIGITAKQSEYSNSTLFSFIEEVLSQLKTIQSFNQEQRELSVFKEKEDVSLHDEITVYGLGFLLNLLIGVVIASGYSLVILYGMRAVFAGEMSTGLLIVFIFYLDNLTNPLLSLLTAATSLKEDYVKLSRMTSFFTAKFHLHETGIKKLPADASIVFDKVSVVGDEGVPILQKASFTIPAGKKTVIVGISGSGKTTIASLILRFINPTSGTIRIGGEDILHYAIKAIREDIAYVPQETMLFNESVRSNILFGKSNATLKEIAQAASLAIADEFIHHLPGGYHFRVGAEGMNLSGGQRQRIILARAFLKTKSKLAIFDEPLSALDISTRGKLMRNINQFARGKTTIIISNILEIIKEADHVIMINHGKIVHTGDHASLLRESALTSLLLESG